MADGTTARPDPVEAWSAFLRECMRGQPATGEAGPWGGPWPAPNAQPGEKQDPWADLIDRLWEANPFSKLVPVDPGEVMRAFTQIWADAARNPARVWSTYA